MTAIIAALIPVVLKFIGFMFDRAKLSKEQKEAFLKFYEAYEKMGNDSVKQQDEIDRQLQELNK